MPRLGDNIRDARCRSARAEARPGSRTATRAAMGFLAAAMLGSAAAEAAELIEAVKAGDHDSVEALLASAGSVGAAANETEPDGTSALHYAVEANDVALVERLLEAGADPTITNRYGVGPLYVAALNGNAAIVERLLAHGVDPNTALPEGETALMTAARSGDVATLDALITAGADVNAREGWKAQTALMWAAAENNAAAITRLLEAGAERDAVSDGGEFNALKFAVRAGAIEATQALLDAGADVNQTMQDGTSMLVLAVTNAHYELAGVLLDNGADPNADAQGWTALHQIAWSRRWNMGFNLPGPAQTGDLDSLDLVRKLVAHGADIDARQHQEPKDGNRNKLDRIGATAFLLAAKSCDLPLMRVLLEQGADPSITTEGGTTALMAAAGVGIWAPGENPGTHEEALAAVQLAYEVGGGDINAVNNQGDTALHGAVYRGGAIPVIEFLAARGAKLDAVNEFGWMPVTAADGLEYTPAVLKRYPEAAALLRQ
ncbi:MAG: ankyrin repeat domain-containing protein, partial [Gammaproteobacteria bacterium]|nr:ankyrin repeat domain-containing protein [Gammaproteobacteria bacterium]